MTASSTLTYDQAPPRRPTVNDLGGGAKENDAANPPDPVRMPTAEDANQTAKQVAAIGGIVPMVSISVRYDGSNNPYVYKRSSLRQDINWDQITVFEDALGEVFVEWTSGIIPEPVLEPKAYLNGGTVGMISSARVGDAVKVYTRNALNAAARLPFTLDIM
jgi:hypothetical protein